MTTTQRRRCGKATRRQKNTTWEVGIMTRGMKGVHQHARHAMDVRKTTTGRNRETVKATRQKMRHTEYKEVGTTDQRKMRRHQNGE